MIYLGPIDKWKDMKRSDELDALYPIISFFSWDQLDNTHFICCLCRIHLSIYIVPHIDLYQYLTEHLIVEYMVLIEKCKATKRSYETDAFYPIISFFWWDNLCKNHFICCLCSICFRLYPPLHYYLDQYPTENSIMVFMDLIDKCIGTKKWQNLCIISNISFIIILPLVYKHSFNYCEIWIQLVCMQ